jgi:hypothetical protein
VSCGIVIRLYTCSGFVVEMSPLKAAVVVVITSEKYLYDKKNVKKK